MKTISSFWKKLTLPAKIVFVFWTIGVIGNMTSKEYNYSVPQILAVWAAGCLIYVGLTQYISRKFRRKNKVIVTTSGSTNPPNIERTIKYDSPANLSCETTTPQIEKVVRHIDSSTEPMVIDNKISDKELPNAVSQKAQRITNISLPSTEELDVLFAEAGKFVIEIGRGSIGMLQRNFKIGFNRACRIMDQLSIAGVVGPEINSKPRAVLMSTTDFDDYLEHMTTTLKSSLQNTIFSNMNYEESINTIESIINDSVDYSHDGEILFKLENAIVPNATDSFKSSFVNTLIKYNSWQKLQLILFDKSQLEFLPYRLLPHLFIPVISDEEKMRSAMDWVFAEMQARTEAFLSVFARNIVSYNSKKEISHPLPVIVIIVNELYGLDITQLPHLNHFLLNSQRMGIFLIGFSKLGFKDLSFGTTRELWKIETGEQLLASIANTVSISDNPVSYDSMDGHAFEHYCAKLLSKNGYDNVEVTRGSGDQGIDVIAFKDGIKYGIQCKCYSSAIGNKAVQEAFAGKAYYGCHVAVVLTNRYFTESAKELAAANKVVLWDRDKLQSLIAHANA